MKKKTRTTLRRQIAEALAAGYEEVFIPSGAGFGGTAGWWPLAGFAEHLEGVVGSPLDAEILDPPTAGLGQVAIGRELLAGRGKRPAESPA